MFQPTARDTMYPITTNKTGYSSTTVLRRNGNAVDIYEKKIEEKLIIKYSCKQLNYFECS